MNISDLKCPITKLIFNEPVLADDGHFYEKTVINNWLEISNLSPLTRETISNHVNESHLMKRIVNDYLEKNPKKKSEQYQLSTNHCDNIKKITKIIDENKYKDLINYTKYDISLLYPIIILEK